MAAWELGPLAMAAKELHAEHLWRWQHGNSGREHLWRWQHVPLTMRVADSESSRGISSMVELFMARLTLAEFLQQQKQKGIYMVPIYVS